MTNARPAINGINACFPSADVRSTTEAERARRDAHTHQNGLRMLHWPR